MTKWQTRCGRFTDGFAVVLASTAFIRSICMPCHLVLHSAHGRAHLKTNLTAMVRVIFHLNTRSFFFFFFWRSTLQPTHSKTTTTTWDIPFVTFLQNALKCFDASSIKREKKPKWFIHTGWSWEETDTFKIMAVLKVIICKFSKTKQTYVVSLDYPNIFQYLSMEESLLLLLRITCRLIIHHAEENRRWQQTTQPAHNLTMMMMFHLLEWWRPKLPWSHALSRYHQNMLVAVYWTCTGKTDHCVKSYSGCVSRRNWPTAVCSSSAPLSAISIFQIHLLCSS